MRRHSQWRSADFYSVVGASHKSPDFLFLANIGATKRKDQVIYTTKVFNSFLGKKMPPALRLGANPPFQRVEETRGVCKKARLFVIVMAFLLHRSK
jgi:hypothetical protein